MPRLQLPGSGQIRPLRSAARRFQHAADGSVAVEFALVSIPFFALLFAILETALLFFAGQVLDTAVTQASRQIRTGQVQQAGMTATAFKTLVCNGLGTFGDCADKLFVEVVRYDDFNTITTTTPVDPDGTMKDVFAFNPGARGDVVVVTGYYEWPAIFNIFGQTSSLLANGNHLLGASVAFRNEPFPW